MANSNQKKSLVLEKEEARKRSLKYHIRAYVLDKKGEHAICHTLVWCVKERILEGWSVVAVFENGEERPFKFNEFFDSGK